MKKFFVAIAAAIVAFGGSLVAQEDRYVTWDYPDSALELSNVTHFEVFGYVDPTVPFEDREEAWLNVGLPRVGTLETYQFLLPNGHTYRHVRACSAIDCSESASTNRPEAPMNVRITGEIQP